MTLRGVLLMSTVLLPIVAATLNHGWETGVHTEAWIPVPIPSHPKFEILEKFKFKKGKHLEWLTNLLWKKKEALIPPPVIKETTHYPVWKIHKYKGIEIRPVHVIETSHHGHDAPLSYPPPNVHLLPAPETDKPIIDGGSPAYPSSWPGSLVHVPQQQEQYAPEPHYPVYYKAPNEITHVTYDGSSHLGAGFAINDLEHVLPPLKKDEDLLIKMKEEYTQKGWNAPGYSSLQLPFPDVQDFNHFEPEAAAYPVTGYQYNYPPYQPAKNYDTKPEVHGTSALAQSFISNPEHSHQYQDYESHQPIRDADNKPENHAPLHQSPIPYPTPEHLSQYKYNYLSYPDQLKNSYGQPIPDIYAGAETQNIEIIAPPPSGVQVKKAEVENIANLSLISPQIPTIGQQEQFNQTITTESKLTHSATNIESN